MDITDDIIDYISVLARLDLTANERETTKKEMGKLLNYMDILNEIDTSGVFAMTHTFPVKNVFREDVIKPSIDSDIITLNAPNKKDSCFKVPKTVE